jgi:hypothetical protein
MNRLWKWLLVVVPFALLGLGFFFRQDIYDWARLYNYNPPKAVVELADNTTMNNKTRRLFYVYHPKIENKSEFNQDCNIPEFSIILGCYIKNRGIYLYKITDKRLDGVVEVTAAHETLHATYDRLSDTERAEVDSMLDNAYHKLDNRRIRDTIKQYEKNDPSSVHNELHSILGTEVRNLPTELENYYKKYFSDRQKIVEYSERYEAEFSSRQLRVAEYDIQLTRLKRQIDADQARLASMAQQLTEDRAELESLRSNPSAYNARVDDFNADVSSYNALVSDTKRLIDDYNALVKKRNNLAVEVQGLVKAIDSTPEKF